MASSKEIKYGIPSFEVLDEEAMKFPIEGDVLGYCSLIILLRVMKRIYTGFVIVLWPTGIQRILAAQLYLCEL